MPNPIASGQAESRANLGGLCNRLEGLIVDFKRLGDDLVGARIHLAGDVPEEPEEGKEPVIVSGAINLMGQKLNILHHLCDLCHIEVRRIRDAIGMKVDKLEGGPA